MDRMRLRQYIEKGLINRSTSVNVRSKLPPKSSALSFDEDLAQQFEDSLSIGEQISHANDIPIDEFTTRDFYIELDSYYRLHEQLLRDREYVASWHSAICGNPHLFKDKIVLDVRCGMGLLSMFAAITGAKQVYAIDKSNIVQLTRRIVSDNRLADKITIIRGSASNIALPVDEVDIIISTPFVISIYHDNSFDEIITARQKWLKFGGLMFPDVCTLYIAAIQDKAHFQNNNEFWHNVYDFNMSIMSKAVDSEPPCRRISRKKLISDACPFKELDFYKMTADDWDQFGVVFCVNMERDSNSITALITFFEIEFTKCHRPVIISTMPGSKLDYWLPTVFYLSGIDDVPLYREDEVYGSLVFNGENKRNAKMRIDLCYRNRKGFLREHFQFEFR